MKKRATYAVTKIEVMFCGVFQFEFFSGTFVFLTDFVQGFESLNSHRNIITKLQLTAANDS